MIPEAYAMAPPSGSEGGGGAGLISFLPIILIFVIFYFLLIRPQQKKQRVHQQMLRELKKGDRILTSGGLVGEIKGFRNGDDVAIVKIDENVKVHIHRQYIAQLIDKKE
jgi:preprotein translocase subunit YajC